MLGIYDQECASNYGVRTIFWKQLTLKRFPNTSIGQAGQIYYSYICDPQPLKEEWELILCLHHFTDQISHYGFNKNIILIVDDLSKANLIYENGTTSCGRF